MFIYEQIKHQAEITMEEADVNVPWLLQEKEGIC